MLRNRVYIEKILKSSATFLARWNGKNAELWELTYSLKTLRILIRNRHGDSGNLLLSCIDPHWIKGPVRWEHCQLQVSEIELPGNQGLGFRILDDSSGLEVLCGELEIKENVKLW